MPWLLKAEPDSRIVKGVDVKYTIDDLKKDKISPWEGVRNPEARKNMLAMKKGDKAFFYRSNTKVPGIVGTMVINKEAYEDKFAVDPKHPYFDAKAVEKGNKWVMVDVKYESHLPLVTLQELKANPTLKTLALIKRSRLSIVPVTDQEWDEILHMSSTRKSDPDLADPPSKETQATKGKDKKAKATKLQARQTVKRSSSAPEEPNGKTKRARADPGTGARTRGTKNR